MRISDWSSDVCSSDLRCEAMRRHAVSPGIEQPGLVSRGLDAATGLIAAPSVMADRLDPPFAIGADAQPLDGGGPMGGVVHDLRPGKRDLHRPSHRARAKRRQHRIGLDPELRAETAADECAHRPDIFLRHQQRLCKTAHAPRSEEHTSELQSLMRISYAVFCLKKKKKP